LSLGAAATVSALGSLISGVSPNSAMAYALLLLAMIAAGALATVLPVRQALRTDILASLRNE
jgi:ABC-type antimicrobial peptide transport system permease subunit